MPKHGDQKVLPSGICTWPPSASALNIRPASASLAAVKDKENPLKLGPSLEPSEAIKVAFPMRRLACMILLSQPAAGKRWFRALFVAHDHQDLGAQRLLVKLDRLFATTVEE